MNFNVNIIHSIFHNDDLIMISEDISVCWKSPYMGLYIVECKPSGLATTYGVWNTAAIYDDVNVQSVNHDFVTF